MEINGLPNEVQMELLGHLRNKNLNGVIRVCKLWQYLGVGELNKRKIIDANYIKSINVLERPFALNYFYIENNTNEKIELKFSAPSKAVNVSRMSVEPNTSLFGSLNKWKKNASQLVMRGYKDFDEIELKRDIDLEKNSGLKITPHLEDTDIIIYDITREEAIKRISDSPCYSYLFRNSTSVEGQIVLTFKDSKYRVNNLLFERNGDGSFTNPNGRVYRNLVFLLHAHIEITPEN